MGSTNFNKYVTMIAYGDDNIISVNDEIKNTFNPQSLTIELGKIGMTYTDENKEFQSQHFRNFSNVTFLKRSFVVTEDFVFAPLSLNSIIEMTNWISKGTSILDATVENCKDAIEELIAHPQATYENLSSCIRRALREKGVSIPTIRWDVGRDMLITGDLFKLRAVSRPWV